MLPWVCAPVLTVVRARTPIEISPEPAARALAPTAVAPRPWALAPKPYALAPNAVAELWLPEAVPSIPVAWL